VFTTRWRLFRLAGIPIYVDASWLIILVLVTWTLTRYFAEEAPGLAPTAYWVMGLVAALGFFVCILLHELGHATVARQTGIPMRGITLFLFGGVAELGGEPTSAASEFFMAIAGPLVSAVLGVGLLVVSAVGAHAGWPLPVIEVLHYLGLINLIVLFFNLVPAFPLDGGRVLRSILWGATGNLRQSTYWASLLGQGFGWLLIGVGIFQFIQGAWVNGIWMSLIGLFVNNSARSSYHMVVVRQALKGEPVRRIMNSEPIVVPPSVDLRHWVEDYVYRYHRKAFPVASNGHMEGFISTRALAEIPREEWDRHTVGEVMRRDLDRVSIAPDADALAALRQMQRTGSSRLLVTEGDRLVGIVSAKDLMRFLNLKMELEDGGHRAAV
jgi:Zn-dependent protease/CBS domain-containing protein